MVCKNTGMYGFLGPSWVLNTMPPVIARYRALGFVHLDAHMARTLGYGWLHAYPVVYLVALLCLVVRYRPTKKKYSTAAARFGRPCV